MKLTVFSSDATKSSEKDFDGLPVFEGDKGLQAVKEVIVAINANNRQGTHSTKTRGEVRGGGKKPYKQKGTGRARQGSTRAPQFTGGGTVHGPTPRDYTQRTPKKMKAAALRGALSDRARHGRVHVVSELVSGDAPGTKAAAVALARISSRPNVLLVLERADELTWKSVRNLSEVHALVVDQLNTYDVLCADDVVFTRGALDAFVAGPVRGRGATAIGVSAATSDETSGETSGDEEVSR